MKGKKFAGLQGLFHNVALPGEPRKKAGRREIAKELCAGAFAALERAGISAQSTMKASVCSVVISNGLRQRIFAHCSLSSRRTM
jgi:hypothetical protein